MTLLLEKGAGRVVVGDMSGIQYVKLTPEGVIGSTRELMKASGMAAAAQKAGAELHFPEELKRNDINTIWDDRVLNRAYQVLGRRPAINMKCANDAVPGDLQEQLNRNS